MEQQRQAQHADDSADEDQDLLVNLKDCQDLQVRDDTLEQAARDNQACSCKSSVTMPDTRYSGP